MSEVTEAYVKQIQSSFEKFIALVENPAWISSVNTENIKIAFKLACFIEKSAKYFDENNMLDQFLASLCMTGIQGQNINKTFDKDTFLNAGDILLMAFFMHQGMSEIKIDVAVKMYSGSFPGQRLEKVLEEFILKSSSYEAILDFVLVNSENSNISELKYKVLLNKLAENYKQDETKIKEHIKNCLSIYKVENNLNMFIGILGLDVTDNLEILVRNVVLDAVLSNMYDRSVISKSFWLCLFKKVEKSNIVKACSISKMFLELLCRFVVYVGSMMESKTINDNKVWCSNPDISICPELSYEDLLSLLKVLSSAATDINSVVTSKIIDAYQQTSCLIFTQLQLDLKLESI